MWQKIPILVRAFLLGATTFYVVQFLAQPILILNVEFAPRVPWAVAASGVLLWLSWRYLSGRGWPASTREPRRRLMRVENQNQERRRLGYLSTAPILLCLTGLAIVSSSIVQFPPESFDVPSFLGELPTYMSLLIVLAYSLAAGVSEEIGFRGYMQVPLEERYGPFWAIAFTATVFWLAHADSVSFLHRTVLLLGAGVLAGTVSFLSRSLVPAVIIHTAADTIGFTTAAGLFGLEPIYTADTIWETGLTPTFVVAVLLTLVGGWVSVGFFQRMARLED